MESQETGFTLVEMIVVLSVLAVLAAYGFITFHNMQNRAKEASTKGNMHTFQLSSEDYGIRHGGLYSPTAAGIDSIIPAGFQPLRNPFDNTTGSGAAWEDRVSMSAGPTARRGLTSYADSNSLVYNVKGQGHAGTLPLVLGTVRP